MDNKKPAVLIVDPDETLQEILSDLLRPKFNVVASASVADARKKIQEHEINLLFTELEIEKENAHEFIESVKRKSPNTLVVVITGGATLENAVTAVRLGAMDFLTKPFSIEDIAKLIEKFFTLTTNKKSDYNILDSLVEEKRVFELPTDFSLINHFLNELLNIVQRFPGLDKKNLLVIRLAVYEMMVNAMEHGNLEITYDMKKELLEKVVDYQQYLQNRAREEPFSMRKIWISYHYRDKKIEFNITDEGKGFNVSTIPSPHDKENVDGLSGRGIFITRLNMNEIFYNEKGNSVTIVKFLD